MSATDNAFIKAYAEELAEALGRPTSRAGRSLIPSDVPDAPASSDAGRVCLSGLYTPPDAFRESRKQSTVPEEVSIEPRETPTRIPQDEHSVGTACEPVLPSMDTQFISSTQTSFGDLCTAVGASQSWLRVDEPDPVVPPSHASRLSSPDVAIAPPEPPDRVTPPTPDAAETSRTSELESTAVAEETFRPQWEVDRFRWPTIVDRLVSSHGDSLSETVDKLAVEPRNGPVVVTITSSSRGEGRTTLTLCLAKLAGQRGMSVALVDGDYDNPAVSEQVGLSAEMSWGDGEENQPPIAEVAVQSIEDNLTILPMQRHEAEHRPTDSGRAAAALATLSASYDLVLIDAGPMFAAARRWLDRSAGLVHRALIVRDLRSTTEHQLADVAERLRSRNVQLLGIAENFDTPRDVQPASSGQTVSSSA